MSKGLILIRGLPGSGKSTLANLFDTHWTVSNDDFCGTFDYVDKYGKPALDNFKYEYSPERIKAARKTCQDVVASWMLRGYDPIVVHNCFLSRQSVSPYLELANLYGYQVTVVHVETQLSNKELAKRNVHGVDEKTIASMRENWEF